MKIHPVKIEGYNGTNEELGTAIFKMRYDQVAVVLFAGMKELYRQWENDTRNGKLKLAKLLLIALYKLGELIFVIMKIFLFCKPFMKDELENNPMNKGG